MSKDHFNELGGVESPDNPRSTLAFTDIKPELTPDEKDEKVLESPVLDTVPERTQNRRKNLNHLTDVIGMAVNSVHQFQKNKKTNLWHKEDSADSRFNFSIQCKTMYEKIQCLELVISLMIIGANIVYIFQYSLEFDERDYAVNVALLTVTMVMMVLSAVLVITGEVLRIQYDEILGKVVKGSNLINTGRYKNLIVNLLVLSVQPYPFLIGIRIYTFNDIVGDVIFYHVNDVLQLLSTFRILFAVGKFFYMSNWLSNSSNRVW